MPDALLEVDGLTIDYLTEAADVRAVEDVSFSVQAGEFVGIVGESGCGKSTMLFGIAQLLSPPGEVAAGRVIFRGKDMVRLSAGELRHMRWRDYSVVMQSAMNALNPMKSIGAQFKDALRAHERMSNDRIRAALGRGSRARGHRPGPPEELSAPAQRRYAPARDDRDGAAVHAAARGHGRADLGARRCGAAFADDQDPRAAGAARLRRDLRHPRHARRQPLLRSRARHVRRPGRRGGDHRADLRAARCIRTAAA